MVQQYRTEIETGAWLQCFRCRKPTLTDELIGRREVVTVGRNLLGIPVIKWEQVVSVCPTCISAEDAATASKRKWQGVALGLVILSVFFDNWLGLVGAGVVLLGGKLWRRCGTGTQVVIWRKR